MSNRKPIKFPRRWIELPVQMPDVTIHLLPERFDDPVHLAVRPFHDHFHPPVGKISHVTGYIVLEGDVLGGVAKADSLHPTAEMNRAAMGRDAGLGMGSVHRALM
jgi:hypothetical protein